MYSKHTCIAMAKELAAQFEQLAAEAQDLMDAGDTAFLFDPKSLKEYRDNEQKARHALTMASFYLGYMVIGLKHAKVKDEYKHIFESPAWTEEEIANARASDDKNI